MARPASCVLVRRGDRVPELADQPRELRDLFPRSNTASGTPITLRKLTTGTRSSVPTLFNTAPEPGKLTVGRNASSKLRGVVHDSLPAAALPSFRLAPIATAAATAGSGSRVALVPNAGRIF